MSALTFFSLLHFASLFIIVVAFNVAHVYTRIVQTEVG